MLFSILRTFVITLACTAFGVGSMHILQIQRYRIKALYQELQKNGGPFLHMHVFIAALTALLNWYLPIFLSMAIAQQEYREWLCGWIMLGVFAVAATISCVHRIRTPRRKPFVWTRRVCRLTAAVFVLNLLLALLFSLISLSGYLLLGLADFVVLLAALVMQPIENRINAGFYNAARKKLAGMPNLIRIGITGSLGKTDTKLILKTILSEKYRVLATPPTFSTALGISRVVNEQLTNKHEIFIAEMGAQQKGEIREMTRLVRPKYGVMTCVNKEHLDSFGSVEILAQTKFELIQSIPEDGAAFFGSDGSYGDRLYAMCKKEKYRTGVGTETKCYIHAENIETSENGTSFELVCADGSRARVQTKLLGNYNVYNIALAAAVAKKLGMALDEIAKAAEKLQPVRHHLNYIPGDVNILDDSRNTRLESAIEALRVLSDLPGRRIVVTNGFVGCESNAADKNFAFGTQIARYADYVVLIDPEKTRTVMNGLMSKQFPKPSVRMVREVEDAATLIEEIAGNGDTVLYECTRGDRAN